MALNDSPTTVEQWSQLTEAEKVDWLACQAEHDDLMSQINHREALYENDLISWDEYCSWEFDYGPLPVLDTDPTTTAEE